MPARLLVLEDSPMDRKILKAALKSYELEFVMRSDDVVKAALKARPDLILLDVSLPVGSGYDACQAVQANAQLADIPIFFVSGLGSSADRIAGLALGAEDYIAKPYDPIELNLRVSNKLKVAAQSSSVLQRGRLRACAVQQKAMLVDEAKAEQSIDLTPIEFRLLMFFMRHEGELFSRKQVVEHVWGTQVHVNERNVDTHIKSLRRKCGPCAHYFESVYGSGYRFDSQATSKT